MAQINLTLDQDEVLELLGADTGETFRMILQRSLNAILKAESAAQLRAQPYERSQKRTDMRNGIRTRQLITRVGRLELAVPRHRDVPFKTLVFSNYSTCEAALVTTMAEMVVAGVSTAKVGRVMEEICGKNFSKQTVSEACKELDETVREFKERPLTNNYLFIMADATYLKVRENHRVCAKALLIAIGLTDTGHKEIIGFDLADEEDAQSWKNFFASLKARGLHDMRMLTSDAHGGIVRAMHEVYPAVAWQRCQAHLTRNIAESTPKRLRTGLRSELVEMFNAPTIEAARARRDEIIRDYAEVAPEAVECLDNGFDDAMTVMELPVDMRRPTRTSNYLERLNKEVKRRSKVIGIFPNAGSVIRLAGAVLMRENDHWDQMDRIYFKPACEQLAQKADKLVEIASIQRMLLQAA